MSTDPLGARIEQLEQENCDLRQRAERAGEQLRMLKGILDSMPHAVYVKDREGRFLFANGIAESMYGASPGSIVGRLQSDTQIDGEQVERMQRADLRLLDGEVDRHDNAAYPIWLPNGTVRRYAITKVRVKPGSFDRDAVLVVADDVTDAHAAGPGATQQGRLAALGQVIARVAHDLRTPLATITATVSGLRRRVGDEGGRTDRALDRLERSVQRCDAIFGDLLDSARADQAVTELCDLDAWLTELLDDETQIYYPIVLNRDLRLTGQVVPVDTARLSRAVLNLLRNACEALQSSHRWRQGERCNVTLGTRLDGDAAVVEVRDDGPGIHEDQLEHAGTALFSTKSTGVGLGLAIAKETAEAHGGEFHIDSVPGQGVCVSLRLPLGEPR